MKKIIIANWKNKPESPGQAQAILEYVGNHLGQFAEQNFTLAICPPFVFIEDVAKLFSTTSLASRVSLGAQDIAPDDTTALTGEITGPMLQKLGVRYVIVGHSERRWKLGESDEVVNKKLKSVLQNEMIPVVCIGEKERAGDYEGFLANQIEATFAGVDVGDVSRCLVAYEPVWAISTNPNARPDNPEDTAKIVEVLKKIFSERLHISGDDMPPILYGGSVTQDNASAFLKLNDVRGVLVGGASVRKEEFVSILSKIH